MSVDPYLPPDIAPERVAACLGLISDTHMPDRCAALPRAVFEVLRGVDLVIHSGDVGTLFVLDELSQIAPVIAVYGNDESQEAKHNLPLQQVIPIAGQRIFVHHGHFPVFAEEM